MGKSANHIRADTAKRVATLALCFTNPATIRAAGFNLRESPRVADATAILPSRGLQPAARNTETGNALTGTKLGKGGFQGLSSVGVVGFEFERCTEGRDGFIGLPQAA